MRGPNYRAVLEDARARVCELRNKARSAGSGFADIQETIDGIDRALAQPPDANYEQLLTKIAEMRYVIRCFAEAHDCSARQMIDNALSDNCGKGWVRAADWLPYMSHAPTCPMPAAPCDCGLESLLKKSNESP